MTLDYIYHSGFAIEAERCDRHHRLLQRFFGN